LTNLLKERFYLCKKVYLGEKNLSFVENIEKDIIAKCDPHYIAATFDNLIINAIQYSKSGTITISLKKHKNSIEFIIQDEGIGIPKNELYDIFTAFVVSSKTANPSGGRGIGLTVAQKSIEAHGGSIHAESDGEHGAKFTFTLPVK